MSIAPERLHLYDWLTPSQAAEYLGVTRPTVNNWCIAGKLYREWNVGLQCWLIARWSIEQFQAKRGNS